MHTVYAPTPRLPLSTSLQLVNRQFHDEIRHVLSRIAHPRYDLDVMVIHEWDFWPTWTNVPVWRKLADEVNVTFRLFGHCALPEWLRSIRGDGGAPGMEWCFYALLERFLVLGPVNQLPPTNAHGPARQRQSDRRFFAHTLTLNVESAADDNHPLPPPEVNYDTYRKYTRNTGNRTRKLSTDLSTYAVRPEWFARVLCSEISNLLGMHYYTLYLGGILYEHIGVIRVLVDGNFHQEFDLAKKLAPMKWDCRVATLTREDRREYFWRWKRDAQRTREKMGFPVIVMDDKEFEEYPEA